MLPLLDAPLALGSRDLGIDLGTANLLIYARGEGIVVNEPSAVAWYSETRTVVASGHAAKRLVGLGLEGEPAGDDPACGLQVLRPVRDGVVAEPDAVAALLRDGMARALRGHPLRHRPHVVVGVPSGATDVERCALGAVVRQAGARRAELIEEPLAAALGAGLPIEEPVGQIVVDIGGGTTEIALLWLGRVVARHALRVAGDELDERIVQFMRREHHLLISVHTAEEVKLQLGSAGVLEPELRGTVRGRDARTGLPACVEVGSAAIREAIAAPVGEIVAAVQAAVEAAPAPLVPDLLDQGVTLVGGGALLRGLAARLQAATRLPVRVADDPLTCVVRGTAKCLEQPALRRRFCARA